MPAGPPSFPMTPKMISGILGLFLAAMMGGLNSRLGVLGLDDIRGVFGYGYDDATWITSFYSAGELVVMPFVAWLVQAFTLRKVHAVMLAGAMALSVLLPFVHDLHVLVALRFFHGVFCGGVIFMFMISLFVLLPAHVRMYGFGFYAMVATFAPNFGVWLTALWTDLLHGWQFLYWHSLLLGLPAMLLVQTGIPAMRANPDKLKNVNWAGGACVVAGGVLVALALSQGVRLDWFEDPFVRWALPTGGCLLAVYAVTDWFHPNPFLELRVFTCHRNVWMVLIILLAVLVVALAGALLPVSYLGRVWGFRPLQIAPVGLALAMPQFVVGPLASWILYRKWVDARAIYILALLVLVLACVLGSRLDAEWVAGQFFLVQVLLAVGLPASIVSTIYMSSNNIPGMLGPSLGGAINTLRAIGTLAGTAIVGQYMHVRQQFHYEWLRDKCPDPTGDIGSLADAVSRQSFVTATADAYCMLGALAAVLVLIVLCLRYTPPPQPPKPVPEGGVSNA